jgi:hypothetical protein
MPVTGFEIKAVDTALQLAIGHIERAKGFGRADAEACQEYLYAAQDAINGLENARIALLVETRSVGLGEKPEEERRLLLGRYELFLRERKFLPVLVDASAGLERCVAALRDDAKMFLIPWGQAAQRRRDVVERVVLELDEIATYLRELRAEVDQGISGPGLGELLKLRSSLGQDHLDLEGVRQYAAVCLDSQRPSLDSWRRRVVILINELRIAFR